MFAIFTVVFPVLPFHYFLHSLNSKIELAIMCHTNLSGYQTCNFSMRYHAKCMLYAIFSRLHCEQYLKESVVFKINDDKYNKMILNKINDDDNNYIYEKLMNALHH